LIETIITDIAKSLDTQIQNYEKVQGGDINQCFCLYTPDGRCFHKINDAERFPQMFEKEAAGLEALRKSGTILVPAVLQHGVAQGHQWLLLEWLEKKPASTHSLHHFGVNLARLHQQPQACFGWHTDNYIGSLQQVNTMHHNWEAFYTECRVMPLVKQLFDARTFEKKDISLAISFCKKLNSLFPEEPPALLHGDLWSGNYMITANAAALFDPAVYFGHREMDIGMSKLFGGFNQAFYAGYEEQYPLEKDWEKRLPLTQLYPLLVHACLFGGHYSNAARQILKRCG